MSRDYQRVDITRICNAENIGKPTTFAGELTNKEDVPYIGYSEVKTQCTPNDASNVCQRCPAMAQGTRNIKIDASNAAMLSFIRTSSDRVSSTLKAAGGIPVKCSAVQLDKTVKKVNLTCATATPITEYVGKLAEDVESLYSIVVPIVIINNTEKVEDNKSYHFDGFTHRDPHTGRVVFLCERVRPMEDDIKSYKLTDKKYKDLQKFVPDSWEEEAIWNKINEVLYELKVNHHRINGRNAVALATLMTFTSPLDYVYGNYGETGHRGWMEVYIAGDTRTGKSEVVKGIMRAAKLGYLVEGESVSYPGLVGATFQHPSAKGYAVNWGLFPRHDKRLIAIDEAHNLNAMEVLPRLNDVRSSGVAKITKAYQGTAPARVRKIIVSNPPFQRTTDEYGFNVEIIKDVMKTPEAVARFDLFVCTRNVDVTSSEANSVSMDIPMHYGPSLNELVRFAWSRGPEQVIVPDDVVEYIIQETDRLCHKYNGIDIPLIESGDTQHKLAKMACSLACMTMALREGDREVVEVRMGHAQCAVSFVEKLYDGEGTGYLQYSRFTGRYTRFANFKEFYDVCSRIRSEVGGNNRELLQEMNSNPVIDTKYLMDTWDIGATKLKTIFTTIIKCRLGKRGRGGMFKRTKRGIDVFRFLLTVKNLNQPLDKELALEYFKDFMS